MRVSLRKQTNAVQIFPPEQPPLKEMVDGLLRFPAQLPKVLKAKKYLEYRLQGKKKRFAKEHSGIPSKISEKQILANPVIQSLLNELVVKEIPDPEVAKRLREMWVAEVTAVEYDPDTKTTMEVTRPHWDMRKYAMDKRLALGGFSNGNLPENSGQGSIVTQIKFTTINVNNAGKGETEAIRTTEV